MGRRKDTREKVEFGDFQTPDDLAVEVCAVLAKRGLSPTSVVEPTCGLGSLLFASLDAFPEVKYGLGVDINVTYVEGVQEKIHLRKTSQKLNVQQGARTPTLRQPPQRIEALLGNFFEVDWEARIAQLAEPILFIGNPPWVTSADLGRLKSANLPEKANFHGRAGLDALTGKSNFDISEWMLIKLISWLEGRDAVVAMLCKTAVARKALSFSWNAGHRIEQAATYRIDAFKHFGAAVDACLLVCEFGKAKVARCRSFESLASRRPNRTLGYEDGRLLADVPLYERWKYLQGESQYKWRSGIKHDCAAVMELRKLGSRYQSGASDAVELEDRLLYPMLKSSEIARGDTLRSPRLMIVTQTLIGADTSHIERTAPRTWRYLDEHRASFDKRGSSIYKGKPPFSIFGVGPYTFAPWKVAISGLYKKLAFRVVGPYEGKPVVLDDTCYFLPCETEPEARLLASMLSSDAAQGFYTAFVFWDAKRPITTDLLRRLDLGRLAGSLGLGDEFQRLCIAKPSTRLDTGDAGQLQLGLA